MKAISKNVLIVIAGVFASGLIMNALRNTDIVKKAIRGFDA